MKGFDLQYLLDLDILSFYDLLESVERIDLRDKADMAYTMLMTSQGEGKKAAEWIQQVFEPHEARASKPVAEKEFLSKFGGGF